jgi:hypothetical protein
VCTGAREKNSNKPFWLVAYSHFKQGREPRSPCSSGFFQL